MAFTFHKSERLSSKIYIARLFEKGNPAVKGFPFRISWTEGPADLPYPAQVVFLVSKKKIGKAVQRNLVRRQMRELYRLNKHLLYEQLEQQNRRLILSVSYLSDHPLPMKEIAPYFLKAFNRLLHELERMA